MASQLSLMTSTYKYDPLKNPESIRILVLNPAPSPDHPLLCSLEETSLSEKPSFEAISYTWGAAIFSKDLILPSGNLAITESLCLALRRFRLTDRKRHLWADAVCINQADNAEKGSQVALMGLIYRSCQKVLIWLGPGDENTSRIIDIYKGFAARASEYGVELGADGLIVGGWNGLGVVSASIKEALDSLNVDYNWTGLDEFYCQAWFGRLWIVQEIALAPSAHVHCGKSDISWDEFLLAATVGYRSVKRAGQTNLRLATNFNQLVQIVLCIQSFKTVNRQRLLTLMKNVTFSQCTDPRDRVFAMLGLRHEDDVFFWPNYEYSTKDVYMALAREALRKHNVAVLYLAGMARRILCKDKDTSPGGFRNNLRSTSASQSFQSLSNEMPSWCPDWTISQPFVSFQLNRPNDTTYSFATHFRPHVRIDPLTGKMHFTGRVLDAVKAGRVPGPYRFDDWNEHRCQILSVKAFFDQHIGELKLGPGIDPLLAFARTIIADGTMSSHILRDPLTTEDFRSLWLEFAATPYQPTGQGVNFENDGTAPRPAISVNPDNPQLNLMYTYSRLFCYRRALRHLLEDRQFIVTNQGRIGLASAVAQPGDWIVAVAGGSTPLVMRPRLREGTGFVECLYVVEDCFLLGLMNGELNQGLKAVGWQTLPLG